MVPINSHQNYYYSSPQLGTTYFGEINKINTFTETHYEFRLLFIVVNVHSWPLRWIAVVHASDSDSPLQLKSFGFTA